MEHKDCPSYKSMLIAIANDFTYIKPMQFCTEVCEQFAGMVQDEHGGYIRACNFHEGQCKLMVYLDWLKDRAVTTAIKENPLDVCIVGKEGSC